MAHAQKPDFVFRRNGRVHLHQRGRQFSRLLTPEVCASALVMLDAPCSEVVWEYWLPTPFASFLFTSPAVRHRVPSGFKRTLPFSYNPIAPHRSPELPLYVAYTLWFPPTGETDPTKVTHRSPHNINPYTGEEWRLIRPTSWWHSTHPGMRPLHHRSDTTYSQATSST